MKVVLICCLFCLLSSSFVLAEKGTSQIIQRAPVPEKPPYQGEVRLVRRESALVVQTVLNSKVMRHLVAAIQKKELRTWPENRDGWLDSRHYSEALYLAYERVQTRAKSREKSSSRYLQLLIEFVLDERRSYVGFYEPTLIQDADRLDIKEKELLEKIKVSRAYAYNNMQVILQDRFKLEAEEVLELMLPVTEEH